MTPSLPCPLRTAAAATPGAAAVLAPGLALTFRELDLAADKAAGRLRDMGIREGDTVAILPSTDWLSVASLAACWRIGASIALLNTRNPPALLQQQVAFLNASVVLQAVPPIADPMPDAVPLSDLFSEAGPGRRKRGAIPSPRPRALAPSIILFTSGSSGSSKAVLHRVEQHCIAARAAVTHNRLAPGDRWLLSLPLYHVSGLGIVIRCLTAGATIVLPGAGTGIGAAVRLHAITHLSLVTTQLQRLLAGDGAGTALATLKAVLLGGGPVPAGLLRDAIRAGLPVLPTYGMTETASQVATASPSDPAPVDPCATPLACWELQISPGGEVLVRGPALFEGYLQADGGLQRPFTPDGWFATGDLGYLDNAGRLHITGRRDNMFISGGENIQPEEIETALIEIPGIDAAVVVAVPDREFGMRPWAFIRSSIAVSDEALRSHLVERLPKYKIPDRFVAWPETDPALPGMKVSRPAMQRFARAMMTRNDTGAGNDLRHSD